jgi:hypothetical protein
MYVWKDITTDLELLADYLALGHLPTLRSLRVSFLQPPEKHRAGDRPWPPVSAANQARLQKLFADSSVALTWDVLPFKAPPETPAPLAAAEGVYSSYYDAPVTSPYRFWESPGPGTALQRWDRQETSRPQTGQLRLPGRL